MEDVAEAGSRPARRVVWRWAVIGSAAVPGVLAYGHDRPGKCLSLGALDGRHFAALEALLHPGFMFAALMFLLFRFDARALWRGVARLARHVVSPVPSDQSIVDRHERTQLIWVPVLLVFAFFLVDVAIDVYARTDADMRWLESSARVLQECERKGIVLPSWGLAER